MGYTENLGDLIREIAKGEDEVYSKVCKVINVSGGFADLAPLDGDAAILGAKLISGTAETPFLITPEIDSVVVATFISKNTAFISLYSEVKEIQLRGGEFGGLVKVNELLSKINSLEEKLNSLISKYNSHTHITTATVLSGPPGVIAPPVAVDTPIAPTTVLSDLENEAVKHG
tara:strand:- start:2400 stop:2918 length:519 start_codon:yes stop_codon:yes gene_type:complete